MAFIDRLEDEDALSWKLRGACLGIDPEVFFPSDASGMAYPLSVCARCPVRGECLDYALTTSQRHGIWGGMGERERERLRKRRGLVRRTKERLRGHRQ